MSLHLHQHHDLYASILIAPTERDSIIMRGHFERDNWDREAAIQEGGNDPGRGEVDWFEVKTSFSCHLIIC